MDRTIATRALIGSAIIGVFAQAWLFRTALGVNAVLLTAAVTRDSVEELGLAPGVAATAAVKATSVMVERRKS